MLHVTRSFATSLCMIIILSACSPLSMLNATVSDDGYESILNTPYGEQARQNLNIHIPNNVHDNADVVVFYYGGRWQEGSKEQYRFVADAFTSQGVITVIPDYRLYPNVDWPDFIRDGASAYEWVKKNIARYHGNPKRVFIAGHSAGAHIAAMVAVREDLLTKDIRRPCGFIGLAGPYDFLPIDQPDIRRVFSSATDLLNTQPISYVDRGDPAMLLLHGLNDSTVKPGNSIRMAERARQSGGQAEIKLYKDVDHTDILMSLSSTFRGFSPALRDSMSFIKSAECH